MDAKKSGVKTNITYNAGETLTNTKLNASLAVLKKAIADLEAVIGDPRDENAPYEQDMLLSPSMVDDANVALGAEKNLNISSIARLIGPMEALNPQFFEESGTNFEVVQSIGVDTSSFPGPHHVRLKYYPVETGSVTIADTTVFVVAQEKTDPNDVIIAGDWYLDYTNGILHAYTEINTTTITYSVDAFASNVHNAYRNATYNVIPDPNQTNKCVATIDGSDYIITLPICDTSQLNLDGDGVALTTADLNFEEQLKLPYVLTNNLVLGDIIPANFIVLKDLTSGTIFVDAEMTYESEYEVRVSGVTLDDTHEFALFTVGTSITESIGSLTRKLWALRTGADDSLRIPASNLIMTTGFDLGSGDKYFPSEKVNNYFPQYLHRDGYDGTDLGHNDGNAMRGKLILAASTRVAGSRLHNIADSEKIGFGSNTGPTIGYTYGGSINKMLFDMAGVGAPLAEFASTPVNATDGYYTGLSRTAFSSPSSANVHGPYSFLNYDVPINTGVNSYYDIDVDTELDTGLAAFLLTVDVISIQGIAYYGINGAVASGHFSTTHFVGFGITNTTTMATIRVEVGATIQNTDIDLKLVIMIRG